MNLKEIILECNTFEDTEENANVVFAQKIDGSFQPNSIAVVLEIPIEEMENLNLIELSKKYCPDLEYFLEMFVLQDFYNDLLELDEYKSAENRIKRAIYYAEYDA